jgi:hypothetical protein
MLIVCFTLNEFEYLKALQVKRRWDWPAIFSTNCHGEIWCPPGYGYTHKQNREDVRGLSGVIDQVADTLLSLRAAGGRFFINDSGASYKDERTGRTEEFVSFRIT